MEEKVVVTPVQTAPSLMTNLISFVPIILIFFVFYFLVIRPANKKQQEHEKLLGSIKKGEKIITSSGIFGTVMEVKENVMTIEIAPNVPIEILKTSIHTVVNKKIENNEVKKIKK